MVKETYWYGKRGLFLFAYLRYASVSRSLLPYNRSLLPYNRSLLPYNRSLLPYAHPPGGLLCDMHLLGCVLCSMYLICLWDMICLCDYVRDDVICKRWCDMCRLFQADPLGTTAQPGARQRRGMRRWQKRPIIRQKRPIIRQKRPIIRQKRPIIRQKRPSIRQKRPIAYGKRHRLVLANLRYAYA